MAVKYARYWLHASNGKGHGVHSPFVFDFIVSVLNDAKVYPCYQQVEAARRALLQNEQVLNIDDFGAGSRVITTRQRVVKAIAQSSLKPAKYSQLLFRMVQYYKPATVVELGTSLGITAAYLASGNNTTKVVTMEGAAEVAAVARDTFSKLQLSNIQLIQGNFDETLQPALQQVKQVDLVFIDGNHRYEPTVRYFKELLQFAGADSMIILDDIHWSEEMEQAWHEVQQHPQVTMTIDLFFIGIVLFKPEFKIKQHFTVRF
ncbi:O-methyltransferase [Deminuibacter soli]|nr:class I SAM-dependent methyltransferase [Deminuibacter soli]